MKTEWGFGQGFQSVCSRQKATRQETFTELGQSTIDTFRLTAQHRTIFLGNCPIHPQNKPPGTPCLLRDSWSQLIGLEADTGLERWQSIGWPGANDVPSLENFRGAGYWAPSSVGHQGDRHKAPAAEALVLQPSSGPRGYLVNLHFFFKLILSRFQKHAFSRKDTKFLCKVQ